MPLLVDQGVIGHGLLRVEPRQLRLDELDARRTGQQIHRAQSREATSGPKDGIAGGIIREIEG